MYRTLQLIVHLSFWCSEVFVVAGRFGEAFPKEVLAILEMDRYSRPKSSFERRIVSLPRHDLRVRACKIGINNHHSWIGDEHLSNVGEAEFSRTFHHFLPL
jgi:hypothetical protein